MKTDTRREKQFTGRHMLVLIVSFFGVVITVNIVLAIFATQSWTGLVVKNSYVASQDFNKLQAKTDRQKVLGWQSELVVEENGVVLKFRDREGEPLTGLRVIARMQRPSHENDDHDLMFRENGPGQFVYRGDIARGLWNLRIVARDGKGGELDRIYRLRIRQSS
ncbi:MAG: FixH family protein [Methyloligellaceae bacterium]